MYSPLETLPSELLHNILRYIPVTELHGSIRHVSRRLHGMVERLLSCPSMIEHINKEYGVMWTLGGYAGKSVLHHHISVPKQPPHRRDYLRVALVFDAMSDTPFSTAGSGMTVIPPEMVHACDRHPRLLDVAAKHVQIFFSWSIHTVYSTHVIPTDDDNKEKKKHTMMDAINTNRYLGVIDYRTLLNWIIRAQKSQVARWLIPYRPEARVQRLVM